MDDSRYIYASGYVRALANKLLEPRVLRQLVDSGGGETFLRILNATWYSSNSMEEFEINLREKSLEDIRLSRKLFLERPLREITGLKYDFFNCSALLKAKHSAVKAEPALFENEGSMDINLLRKAVYEGKTSDVPGYIVSSIAEAEKRFEQTASVLQMELALDAGYMKTFHLKCGETGNRFFIDFSRIVSDLFNINTFFRIKLFMPGINPADALVDTGSAEPRAFAGFKDDDDGLSRFFALTPYSDIVSGALAGMKGKGALARIEAMSGGLLLRFLAQSRYVTMGPEPVFSYFWFRAEEIKSLRVISAGIRAGLPAVTLAERVALLS